MNTTNGLKEAKDSLFELLAETKATPAEVRGLVEAIDAGRIYGSSYLTTQKADCGCIYGQLAIGRDPHTWYGWISGDHLSARVATKEKLLPADSQNLFEWRTIERFIMRVEVGDTPATSEPLAYVKTWLEEWLAKHD